jgi:xylan 1,4-beta-xylosidase
MHSGYTVSAQSQGKPLIHYWETSVGAGRANEGLRANWQEQLQQVVNACGFRYVRFHGIFHDDMFVCQRIRSEYQYNWQYVDELFDCLLASNIRPFVELGFCPHDIASGEDTIFWWKGNITPPRDYKQWGNLVTEAVQHWIARYGLNEVRCWYFEVWNEPNLSAFWSGTQSQYFALYKESVQAIKAIDIHLRVGGPASSNYLPDKHSIPDNIDDARGISEQLLRNDSVEWRPVWVEQFLSFCQQEELPVDFVSTHPYPTDLALDLTGESKAFSRNISATVRDLTYVRELVNESTYPDAEIHLTEWSSSPSPRDFAHDYLPAATFVVKANIEASGLVDTLSYWTFTDVFEENGAGNAAFHGGFGLVNFQGIVKPTFHAYRLLHTLGNEEIYRADGCIVTRHTQTAEISILLYHYPDEVTTVVPRAETLEEAQVILRVGTVENVSLEICDLVPNTEFLIETVDEQHGFVTPEWETMGCPSSPTREQTRTLQASAWNTHKKFVTANTSGVLSIHLSLKPWSLVSIRTR